MLKELYKKLNESWIYPILIMFGGFVITYFLLQVPKEIAYNLSIIIFFISILIPLVFGIVKLFKKEFLAGGMLTLSSLIIGGFAFFFLSFMLMFYPYDFFADDLEIPQNIKFEKPINLNENLSSDLKTQRVSSPTFLLYDGIQGGIYQYEVYLNKIEKGIVYLKIYEITQNEILSENGIERESKISVFNPTNELKKFKLKDDFTVFEGNWDQYYGSKIEVWFKPENKAQKERKLFSKNYIIQGWQR